MSMNMSSSVSVNLTTWRPSAACLHPQSSSSHHDQVLNRGKRHRVLHGIMQLASAFRTSG